MSYPQTRVPDPSPLFSGTVPLPLETPFAYFDLSGSPGAVDASLLPYSCEMTLIEEISGNTLTILCPPGWTTPAGAGVDFVLPSSGTSLGGAWVVLYDFPHKLITLIAQPAGAGGVASVGATAPATSTGGPNPVIGVTAASAIAAGSMSAADFAKLAAITAAEIDALVGTNGAPGAGNKYVTDSDPRNTNVRPLFSTFTQIGNAGVRNAVIDESIRKQAGSTLGGTVNLPAISNPGDLGHSIFVTNPDDAAGVVINAAGGNGIALPGGSSAAIAIGPGQCVLITVNTSTLWVPFFGHALQPATFGSFIPLGDGASATALIDDVFVYDYGSVNIGSIDLPKCSVANKGRPVMVSNPDGTAVQVNAHVGDSIVGTSGANVPSLTLVTDQCVTFWSDGVSRWVPQVGTAG